MKQRLQRLSKSSFIFFVLVLAIIPVVVSVGALPPAAGVEADGGLVSGLRVSAESLAFRFELPPISIEDGQVSADGLTVPMSVIGAPALPIYKTWIALPPGADAVVTVAPGAETVLSAVDVAPVPEIADRDPLLNGETIPSIEALGLDYRPNPAIYQTDALYPDTLYTVSEPQYLRDLRLVELTLHPLRYNAARQTLVQTQAIAVQVTFTGADTAASRPAPAHSGAFDFPLDDLVLNADYADAWRSLPPAAPDSVIPLPIGKRVFKIEVAEDGIYDISRTELAAAGMNVSTVNPNTLQMVYRGETVAFQLVNDDGDNQFDANERVRFYGWAFDDDAFERQYVTNNVYWLWDGGTTTRVTNGTNAAGQPLVSDFQESLTVENDRIYFPTWSDLDEWNAWGAEPDAIFWDEVTVADGEQTYDIVLPDPIASAPDATYTVEIFGWAAVGNHTAIVRFNESPEISDTMNQIEYATIVGTVPAASLIDGSNTAYVTAGNPGGGIDALLLNRITVDYRRALRAVDDELTFTHAGAAEFRVENFSANAAADAVVWNVADRNRPIRIPLQAGDISGSGPYTYRIGSAQAGEQQYIATTSAAVRSVEAISNYTPTNISPSGNRADWVAVTHSDFMTPINQLATYREANSGLDTHVVDIADIIAQYGYGLPIPTAIQAYLTNAFATWATPPSYLLLGGDSSNNPRNIICDHTLYTYICGSSSNEWTQPVQDADIVPTGLVFADEHQGQVSVDYIYATLVGNDLLPDLAVGRLPAKTAADMQNMVSKIILYETSVRNGDAWIDRVLFVADNADGGGDFCAANQSIANDHVPPLYTKTHLCLDDYIDTYPDLNTAVTAMRADAQTELVAPGSGLFNYRGHGGQQDWTNDGLINVNDDGYQSFWLNVGRPTVILSLDCLDGEFSYTNRRGLGETFLKLDSLRGTAAHWSSSGLGFTFEHTILHAGLYDGLFVGNQEEIGNAVNYAKTVYANTGYDESELYTFNLQGDPAMMLRDLPDPPPTSTPTPTSTATASPTPTNTPTPTSTATPTATTTPPTPTATVPPGTATPTPTPSPTPVLDIFTYFPIFALDP